MPNSSLKQYVLNNFSNTEINLHLGCGGNRVPNYINVDLYPSDTKVTDTSRNGCVADVFCDIRKLELDENTVDNILTQHVVEHFTRWDAIDMIRSWFLIIKPNGKLITEMPDFRKCVLWLFHFKRRKRDLAKSQFYGNQWDRLDYETHRYVWSATEFEKILLDIGFSDVSVTHKTNSHVPGRDMRVVAIK